jgi:DNA-binding transcriptional LysR family regulator
LLSRDFGSRQLFDAACRIAQFHPRVVLESREPHSLVALAEAGQGVAIVPSTVTFLSQKIWIMPLLHEGRSLGAWGGLAWDPRRSLPKYATSFMEELTAQIARSAPGRRFDRLAPPLPLQPASS